DNIYRVSFQLAYDLGIEAREIAIISDPVQPGSLAKTRLQRDHQFTSIRQPLIPGHPARITKLIVQDQQGLARPASDHHDFRIGRFYGSLRPRRHNGPPLTAFNLQSHHKRPSRLLNRTPAGYKTIARTWRRLGVYSTDELVSDLQQEAVPCAGTHRPVGSTKPSASYRSWCRTQSVRVWLGPVSLRPFGVRSRNR